MHINKRRRTLLFGALAASPSLWSATVHGNSWSLGRISERLASAAIPENKINLASYGGVPGAAPATLQSAFSEAFSALKEKGGGTLLVPAGLYDFGKHADSTLIVRADDLNNVVISAYGATFKATTVAKVMPFMFYFLNPNNITIAGARFTDPGFNPYVNWKGMYCAGIQADKPSHRFKMTDCFAERVIGLFSSNNAASTRHYLSDIDIHGEVRDSYYGVGASFIRERVKVDLVCHNVRRAFIANALKDAVIKVRGSSTRNWPGSNGFISLASDGSATGNVENVRVKIDATGAGIYGGYVHFYHHGPAADGYIRQIDATVNLSNVSSAPNLFVFDYETDGVQRQTKRVWDKIYLHGKVTGDFDGHIVSNPSVSSSHGSIFIDRDLMPSAEISSLPPYFHLNPT